MSIASMMSGMSGGGPRESIAEAAGREPRAGDGESGEKTELHPHGDGTYHTVTGGEKTEHPSIGHALVHMGGHHEPEGKHTHVHSHDDGTHTIHHAEGGEVSGPHDAENIDALKEHMDKFLGEEAHESYGAKNHEEHDGLM